MTASTFCPACGTQVISDLALKLRRGELDIDKIGGGGGA